MEYKSHTDNQKTQQYCCTNSTNLISNLSLLRQLQNENDEVVAPLYNLKIRSN